MVRQFGSAVDCAAGRPCSRPARRPGPRMLADDARRPRRRLPTPTVRADPPRRRFPTPTVRADPSRRRFPTPTVRADRSRADCVRFARVAMRAAAPRCARLLPGCVRNGLADARCAPSPSAPAAAPPCAPTLPARIVPGSRGLRCARIVSGSRGLRCARLRPGCVRNAPARRSRCAPPPAGHSRRHRPAAVVRRQAGQVRSRPAGRATDCRAVKTSRLRNRRVR